MKRSRQSDPYIKSFGYFFACFILCAILLYWVAGDEMEAVRSQTSTINPSYSDGGLAGSNVLEQPFIVQTDTLDQLLLYMGTFGRKNQSSFTLQLWDDETCLWEKECNSGEIKDQKLNAFMLDEPLTGVKRKQLVLRILTDEVPPEQAISFYYGNTVSASKVEVAVQIDKPLIINGTATNGLLCLSLIGRDYSHMKMIYWPLIGVVSVSLFLLYFISYLQYQKKGEGLFKLLNTANRYRFLMKQLVSRDFKTKYKRSVLGIFWSFLNPLLTMSVQYLIFSSLFKSSIDNFAVYLMTGGIVFNFFSEAVSLCMTSIVGNAPLITKVYMPKVIYPTSRVLSSLVNVVIANIPLIILTIVSGLHLHKAILLLPLVLLFTAFFCLGMGLLMSSAMVFFRDVQFLWGILSMLWMYMTPIFYPESIIPQQFIRLYHCNPLYQFIYFLREIIIDGTAPAPRTFLFCTVASVVPLLLGIFVFKKTEDKFVFYL